eukprot:6008258-Pyramimonas_sp.AAC.1
MSVEALQEPLDGCVRGAYFALRARGVAFLEEGLEARDRLLHLVDSVRHRLEDGGKRGVRL